MAVTSSETMNVDMFIAKNLAAGEYEAGLSLSQQIKSNKSSGDPNILLVYDVVKSGLVQKVPVSSWQRLSVIVFHSNNEIFTVTMKRSHLCEHV